MADDCGPTVEPSPKLNVYELMATASLDAEASAVTGRGLSIVDALASEWGEDRLIDDGFTKSVWFRVEG